ncbi:MAG TPA: chromate efflux transporter [Longimicrobium sp.]|nr:chromate efflux transporter [Longimicrobium sp.]
MNQPTARTSLAALALLFAKLGTTAFGGPAAHVAMMEDEVVRRRGWLTREEFLDFLGASNLIPGPSSTELAMHVGRERRGWAGLVVAGAAFIVPASIIVGALAWAYVRFGTLPQVAGLLYGIKPVVIAVILQAVAGLGRTALKTRALWIVAAGAALLFGLGVNELLALALAGLACAAAQRAASGGMRAAGIALVWPAGAAAGASVAPASLGAIFGVFLKIGAVLFGSGYVLVAFLRADLVERLGWLTERQLLDAVAIGQVTPGPVFTTATFIGYILAGVPGAVVATVAIFLPAFVFVAVSGSLVRRIRASPTAGAALDGVNAASLALMAAVTVQLARTALVDPLTLALALASAVLLIRYRVNSAWLVLGGAAVGLARTMVVAGM